MKKVRTNLNFTSYLDVSQFIIKEHSPLIKPSSPQHHHLYQVIPFHISYISSQAIVSPVTPNNTIAQDFMHISPRAATPEIAPIDHDLSHFHLTPYTSALLTPDLTDILEDFILDSGMDNCSQNRSHGRKKKGKRYEGKTPLALQMFRLDSQLERIIEDDEEQSNYIEEDCSESQLSSKSDEQDQVNTISSSMYHWALKSKSKDYSLRDTQQQRQSTIDLAIVDYSQTIHRFAQNPKIQILHKIREIQNSNDQQDELQKKNIIKKYLQKYLIEYETYCFEEAWKELNQTLASTVTILIDGIQETFSKKVGVLSFESRRVKLLKYLEKKKKRIWRKKVSYDCRKKVADGRLRIKGKFVTREQACEQLGLESLDNYSADQIKEMLQRRIDESLAQQLVC